MMLAFEQRQTVALTMIGVSALCAVAPSAAFAWTFDAPIAHILLCHHSDHSALAMQHSFCSHCDTTIAAVLPPFDCEDVPIRKG